MFEAGDLRILKLCEVGIGICFLNTDTEAAVESYSAG